jgi:hypothetical protein
MILVKAYDEKEKADWVKRRWELYIMMQMHPYIKAYNKPHSPEQWIHFPWEEGPKIEGQHIITQADMNKLNAIFKKRSN